MTAARLKKLPAQRKSIRGRARRSLTRRILYWAWAMIAAFYLTVELLLLALRWAPPPFTAVQAERRLNAVLQGRAYLKRYAFVPLRRISPNMQHAVVAAEDTRFFEHHGFDWREMEHAVEQDLGEGRKRGASTITQQLVRNLFLSTTPSLVRKGIEMSLVPLTELTLSKKRILELYLNVIEYGPGVYGCEAAARYYFSTSAANLSRDEAIKLAEVLPAPLHWKPGQKPVYGSRISQRMHQAGW